MHQSWACLSSRAEVAGKDFIIAVYILWFVLVFPSTSVCTAPTGTQLSTILWSEVKKLISKIKYDCIKSLYVVTNDKVKCSGNGYESFVIARASGNKNASALSGYHNDYMTLIADEATGISDEVFEPLEMTMTGKMNILLLIFNPVVLSGYAYDSQEHPVLSKQFIKLHWPSTESNIVSKESIERAEERYGINSNYYRTSIAAKWPKESTDSLIPIHMARWCINRQYDEETAIVPNKDEPIVIGVDPSRSGANGCDTICTVRQGSYIYEFYKPENQVDSVKMADEIIDVLFSRYPNFTYCFVETNGLGGVFYDIIKKYDKDRIIPVNVADKNVDEEFLNMRAQLWFRLREAIISGFLGINPEIERNETEIFISQITDIKQDKVSVQNSGKFKVKIESKKDMASRGISSPDYGDATILSFYYTKEQLAQRLSIGKYKPVSDAYSNEDDIPSWMV